MKSQVLHTVWRSVSGEAAGEIWHWSLLGVKGLNNQPRTPHPVSQYGHNPLTYAHDFRFIWFVCGCCYDNLLSRFPVHWLTQVDNILPRFARLAQSGPVHWPVQAVDLRVSKNTCKARRDQHMQSWGLRRHNCASSFDSATD